MADSYFNYFSEVEEHFVRKRGKNLLVSPLDWCLIELWKESRIPLHIVLRGIDRSFEVAEKKHKSTPRTLYYCHPAVMEAYEEYQEAMIGSGDSSLDIESESETEIPMVEVVRFVASLIRKTGSRTEEPFQRATARLTAIEEELSNRQSIRFEELERELYEIGAQLTASLREGLSLEASKTIVKSATDELKVYKKRISKEQWAQLKKKNIERHFREHFDVPEFSLLTQEL
jgi:hypothetical protein